MSTHASRGAFGCRAHNQAAVRAQARELRHQECQREIRLAEAFLKMNATDQFRFLCGLDQTQRTRLEGRVRGLGKEMPIGVEFRKRVCIGDITVFFRPARNGIALSGA